MAKRKAARKKPARKTTAKKSRKKAAPTRAKRKKKPAARKKRAKPAAAAPKRATVQAKDQSGFKLQDDVVERALASGEHRDLLEAYFGESGYEELVGLAGKARSRAVRGGPRVLILPGIMGSKLGRKGWIFDDTLWLDPIDVARGKLTGLALGGRASKIVPLGVILMAYLKLKLQLGIRGFDTEFHAFDWRRDVEELGKELARRIQDETKKGRTQLSLVAHSMGGLVARAAMQALGKQQDKVQRLVMLGTPNHGSFVPVQALRGAYSVVKKVAALDLKHDADELAEKVFKTFPGLYQMLPFRDKYSSLDLYDPAVWPQKGPRPDAAILRAAPKSQARLAPGNDRMVMIAGAGQETTTGVTVKDGGFEYSLSMAGDGTVPLELALLDNVASTYYAEESHGSLPNNSIVGRAVGDILETGETSELPDKWSPRRRAGEWRVAEQDLEVPFEGKKRGELGAHEQRHVLDELAAPPTRSSEATLAPGVALRVHGTSAEPIVVGRRKQHRLDIYLAHGSITQVRTRAIVLGLFKDVEPSGPAGAIDRALDGAITEFMTRRMFNGRVGEVFLLPTGQHTVRADLVGFVGLGSYDQFGEEVLRLAGENLVRTLTRSGVKDFATVLIGSGSATSLRDSLQSLVEGVFQGIRDVDERSRLRSITLCEMDTARYEEMKSALLTLSTTSLFDEVEVTLEEVEVPVEPEAPVTARAPLIAAGPDPVYLIVREDAQHTSTYDFRASALTSGRKATVVSDIVSVDRTALTRHLKRISNLDYGSLPKFGADLGRLVLPESVATVLKKARGNPLVVIHDAVTSRIPWETLHIDGWAPAADKGLSRKYAADNMSVAKWLDERRMGKVLDLLLIVNPTLDLDGAEAEGERVREQFAGDRRVRIRELRREEATWTAVRAAFSSGSFDMVHYAGHAYFDPNDRRRSGIFCHDDRVLTGADLAGLSRLPALVFFNACESGRLRGGGRLKKKAPRKATKNVIDRNVGLAEAFLRGGIANYVGTYWPVGDIGAKNFCEVFYDNLLAGEPIGVALQKGRDKNRRVRNLDWADYVLYGNPGFTLKVP